MEIIEINSINFEDEVINNKKRVLVDFNASWCGPCRMLRPVLEDIASNRNDIDICSINVDDEEVLAQKYGVMSIPCLILFENGNEISRSVGFKPKEEIERFIGE